MGNPGVDRRRFLKSAALGVLAASAASGSLNSRAQQPVPYTSGTGAPKLKLPANSCDCHMHIYDSRFPFVANATLKPPDAHVQDYRLLQKRLGTTRTVVVQPSSYGTDNRCTLDAVEQLGATARAIAVVNASVTDTELKRLGAAGLILDARGREASRMHMSNFGGARQRRRIIRRQFLCGAIHPCQHVRP